MKAYHTLICVSLNGIEVKTSQVIDSFSEATGIAGEDTLAWHR